MESKDTVHTLELPRPKVLVTGGAGFVGSHVCETLLERDCDITVLDVFLHVARADTSSVAPDQLSCLGPLGLSGATCATARQSVRRSSQHCPKS